MYTRCEFEGCEKKDECARYLADMALVNHEAICGEKFGYKYFWQKNREELDVNETKE